MSVPLQHTSASTGWDGGQRARQYLRHLPPAAGRRLNHAYAQFLRARFGVLDNSRRTKKVSIVTSMTMQVDRLVGEGLLPW
jgi:hypothetical protein